MILLEVFTQHVAPKVAVEIAPCSVDMVGAILRIGILEQKSGALDSVIMGLEWLCAASPGKTDLIDSGLYNFCPILLSNNSTVTVDILLNQVR